MADFEREIRNLCTASRAKFSNPYEKFDWPATRDLDAWYTSPELASLYGTEAWDQLSERQQKDLAFFEAVNFFSINIRGEMPAVAGVSNRLHLKRTATETPFLHHFIDEENKHMVMFGEFCLRYADKVYQDRKIPSTRSLPKDEEDFLFYTQVLCFEEISDYYNTVMGQDKRLAPIAQQINLTHHLDESRHLVFGRLQVERLFNEGRQKWSPEAIASMRQFIPGYLKQTWQEYFNPEVYQDAKLDKPFEWARKGPQTPAAKQRFAAATKRLVGHLLACGILEKEPEL